MFLLFTSSLLDLTRLILAILVVKNAPLIFPWTKKLKLNSQKNYTIHNRTASTNKYYAIKNYDEDAGALV